MLVAMNRPSEGWQNGQVVPATCLYKGTKKAISPDTKYAIMRHPQNKAQITLEGREKNGTLKKIFKHPDEHSVYSVCWNPNSRQFATIIMKHLNNRGQLDCQSEREAILMLYIWSIKNNERPLLTKDITGSPGNEYKGFTSWNSWNQFLCTYNKTNVLLDLFDLRLEAGALS